MSSTLKNQLVALGYHPNKINEALQITDNNHNIGRLIKEMNDQRIFKLNRTMTTKSKQHQFLTALCPLCLKISLTINPKQQQLHKYSQFQCQKCSQKYIIDHRLTQINMKRKSVHQQIEYIKQHTFFSNHKNKQDLKLKIRASQHKLCKLRQSIQYIRQQNKACMFHGYLIDNVQGLDI